MTRVLLFLAATVVVGSIAAAGASWVGHDTTATDVLIPSAAAGPTLNPAVEGPPPPAEAPPAAVPLPTPDDPGAFLGALATAAKQWKWLALVALLIIGLVWLGRTKWVTDKIAWFGTPRGGSFLNLLLGALTEIAVQLWTKASAPPGAAGGLASTVAAGLRAILKPWLFPKGPAAEPSP